jgi:hypothetical protein
MHGTRRGRMASTAYHGRERDGSGSPHPAQAGQRPARHERICPAQRTHGKSAASSPIPGTRKATWEPGPWPSPPALDQLPGLRQSHDAFHASQSSSAKPLPLGAGPRASSTPTRRPRLCGTKRHRRSRPGGGRLRGFHCPSASGSTGAVRLRAWTSDFSSTQSTKAPLGGIQVQTDDVADLVDETGGTALTASVRNYVNGHPAEIPRNIEQQRVNDERQRTCPAGQAPFVQVDGVPFIP